MKNPGEKKQRQADRELRKEKIIQGCEEMAELYKTDPELKEWNEFVGDYFEDSEEYMTNKEEKNEEL